MAKVHAKIGLRLALIDRIPWVTCPAASVAIAAVVAGKATSIDLSLIANVGLSVAVPAGIVKYLWDRRQKRRQRKRLDELEKENEALKVELAETRGRLSEVRALIPGDESTGRKP